MLTIVTDNRGDQINGVVTTYREMAKVADVGVRIVGADLFRGVRAPGQPDIKLCWPVGLGKYLSEASHIHVATEGPLGLAAVLWCRERGIPYTSAYHTKFPEALPGRMRGLARAYMRWFHGGASACLVTTGAMRDELSEWLEANLVVWARGVSGDFCPGPASDGGYLLYVGRVSAEKGLEDFLGLGGRKVVVGDGPALKGLRAKYPDVEWWGWRTGAQLVDAYRGADVFVFPSRWDTYGLVMLEAIACGTPVAAYPCASQVVGPEQGVLHEDLGIAVEGARKLGRVSGGQSWNKCWEIFKSLI